MTIQEFIERNKITANAGRTDRNPAMDGNMDHWKVTLTLQESKENPFKSGTFLGDNWRPRTRRMTLTFSKGYGHKGAPPTAEEVLECLQSDASGYSDSFEDWADNYGYDLDSRKAEKIYKACQRQTQKLQNFLGDTFDDFMNCKEA